MSEGSRPNQLANDVAPAVLERELQLVRDAIAMVAAGGSPRVTVAGIRFGDNILEQAHRWAVEAGVRIEPLWRTDESGVDIAVAPASSVPSAKPEP
ncbi:MAG TPA: hypothetical protein VET90_09785 [Candidatus Binatus sp.]|nr:hypothetical protein [Candidatus Binatus sp.]